MGGFRHLLEAAASDFQHLAVIQTHAALSYATPKNTRLLGTYVSLKFRAENVVDSE